MSECTTVDAHDLMAAYVANQRRIVREYRHRDPTRDEDDKWWDDAEAFFAAHDAQVRAEALLDVAFVLDDPKTLPDLDDESALAIIEWLRDRAARIEQEGAGQ